MARNTGRPVRYRDADTEAERGNRHPFCGWCFASGIVSALVVAFVLLPMVLR